jgi:protein-disulfide isomerase
MHAVRTLIVAIVAIISIAAAPPARQNWNNVVAETPQGGHLVGNPAAEVKLIEYVSYTCPHCAQFEVEADATLRLTFIATGKGSIEYRPLLRNKIDLAVSLLAGCGAVPNFRANHSMFLRRQSDWFGAVSPVQEQRWASPDFGTSMRAIASDLRLYALMESRGYTRPQLDRCLSDKATGSKLAQQTQFALEKLKVSATPSFLINGELQDAHDWAGLRPRLTELMR